MRITVQSSKAVKPAYGRGCNGDHRSSGAFSFATADFVPLTVLDKVAVDAYISRIYFFRPPAPSNSVVEAGLAKALAEYREWAGRLGVDACGNRGILLNDAGVRFVEAAAGVALDAVLPWEPTPEALSLHPSGDGAEELMLLQFTRFACGSFAVGVTVQHLVSDGPAGRNFVIAWGQATRGAAVDPVPVHDRVSFFLPRDPPRVEFEHRGAEFKPGHDEKEAAGTASSGDGDRRVVVHRVHFSREMISELKSRASPPPAAGTSRSRPYSRLQCVVAHLWQCITAARDVGRGETTELRVGVNGRARMRRPRVPEGYTGNVVLWARPAATAGELAAMPLQRVAELVRREVARVDDGYFRSFVDFASSGVVEREALVPTTDPAVTVLSPHVFVYSVLQSPFREVDFGGGELFFFMPGYLEVEGLVIVVPSLCHDGSIDAYVSLFSHTLETFKTCCYSLETAKARL
ncbi:hypothetical protein PAHAL_8G230100 [Panicum hallii]|uniref:Uncharacterized protein n=1 Tax=Panicum hallii TaxID=206008 RepID=A0A2S3IFC6_9POAL|nr:agmatine coumaroyltransferase-2-like [Panicum hallii]PAN43351.1 hypothetical protein PAHAL_8G230100 [Panicum hallii]